MNEPLLVMKFGGTSVQDAEAIRRLAAAVAAERRPRVVVVSALAGVTDALSALADGAARVGVARQTVDELCTRHVGLARETVAGGRQFALTRRLQDVFGAAAELASAAGPPTPARRDALLAVGELASSAVVAEALASAGLPAGWVDARRVVVTDDAFGIARPDPGATRAAARRELGSLLAAGGLPVVGGFIGATPDGATTTIGRGGSDYSAALLAAALDAGELQIWTDVDGVLTADPRVVASTVRIPRLSFDEAYELARFGAKVLHWGTLEPIATRGIPVRVLDSRHRSSEGTLITASPTRRGPAVVGLAHQTGVAVADVRARGVAGSRRFLESALAWLESEGRRATVVSLSANRAVVAAPDSRLADRFVGAVSDGAASHVAREAALVALVGDRIAGHADVWRALNAELDAGRLTAVVPAQSGHALVSVTSPSAAPAVLATLHEQLVGAAVNGRRVAGGWS